jgi:hypothetical protein
MSFGAFNSSSPLLSSDNNNNNNNNNDDNINYYNSFELLKNPLISYDVNVINGRQSFRMTFHNCITALKEYQNKSLEELRWEDYMLNKRYPNQTSRSQAFQQQPQSIVKAFLQQTLNTPLEKNGTKLVDYEPSFSAEVVCNFLSAEKYSYRDVYYKSISAMFQYESMAFEELRWLDYTLGSQFKVNKKNNDIPKKTKADESDKSEEALKQSDETICPICLESLSQVIYCVF